MSTLRFDHPDFNRNVFFKPAPEMLPATPTWAGAPRLIDLPSWRDAKRICIDVETKDTQLRQLGPGCRREGNRVVGVAFAIEDGPDYYVPLSHDGGDNITEGPAEAWRYFADQLRDFRGTIVGNGINYDQDWVSTEIHRYGMSEHSATEILRKQTMDVQCADVLIDEDQFTYNLDALCNRHGLPGKDEAVLRQAAEAYKIDAKTDMWKLPARYVDVYGRADARRPLQVLRRQERLIESEGVSSIWQLEQAVTPILVKMRRRGVRVDMNKLDLIEARALEVETECLRFVYTQTGVRINVGDVWKGDALAHALRAAGFAPGKTAAGRDSVDKILLAKSGEVGAALLRAREWNKLRTTFVKQVREHAICHGPNHWRVHCTFHQLRNNPDGEEGGRGVRYGRFSSTDFNIQQMPVRHDEFGEMWRSIFIANEGCEWVCEDFSQQEPRIAVHYAEALGLTGAKDFADAYRENPSLDIHQKLSDISGVVRKIVKNTVNGRLYGMSDTKLCKAINKPTEWKMIRGEMKEVPGPEGRAMIDQFDSFAPWIRGLVREASKAAERVGHVWTILRRKCRFQRGPDGKIQRAHKSFNRVGQGSAADAGKATLVAADRENIPIQLAVHDEFDFSQPIGDRRMSSRMKELMMTTVQFSVPMKVDIDLGPSWGEGVKQ